MPLYDFECPTHGVSEHYASMDETTRKCECGKNMKRLISFSNIIPDADFVTDDLTGEPVRITSNRQLNRLCKETGNQPSYGKNWW